MFKILKSHHYAQWVTIKKLLKSPHHLISHCWVNESWIIPCKLMKEYSSFHTGKHLVEDVAFYAAMINCLKNLYLMKFQIYLINLAILIYLGELKRS